MKCVVVFGLHLEFLHFALSFSHCYQTNARARVQVHVFGTKHFKVWIPTIIYLISYILF
jgi:hypothetical protein